MLEIQANDLNEKFQGIPEHDCLMNLSRRCTYLEGMIDDLSFKFKELKKCITDKAESEGAEKVEHPRQGTIRRYELELPEMKRMQFIED